MDEVARVNYTNKKEIWKGRHCLKINTFWNERQLRGRKKWETQGCNKSKHKSIRDKKLIEKGSNGYARIRLELIFLWILFVFLEKKG